MCWYEQLDEKVREYLPDMTMEREVPPASTPPSASAAPPGGWPFPPTGSSW